MAVATSLLHRSLSGAVGDLIFRNYNGKTVVSVRPVYKNETNTEPRRKARGRFRDATSYASNAMENPKLKAYYQQKARQLKLPNAYTAAITEYLRRAKVVVTTRSTFAGKKGERINIRVSKSVFRVSSIKATLYNNQNDLLLEQNLSKHDSKKGFEFMLHDNIVNYAYLKISTDEPGPDIEYVVMASAFLKIDL